MARQKKRPDRPRKSGGVAPVFRPKRRDPLTGSLDLPVPVRSPKLVKVNIVLTVNIKSTQ